MNSTSAAKNAVMGHSSIAVGRHFVKLAAESKRTLSPMKLIKLVYMAHGWMLGIYGRPLVREPVEAWRYGPVFPELYYAIKENGHQPVPPDLLNVPNDEPLFDEEEISLTGQVHDIYARYTAFDLSRLTHEPGSPWHKHTHQRGALRVIPNDLIEDHYEKLYTEHKNK